MQRLRLVAIFTALAVVVAACGEPIPPAETHTLTVNVGGDGTGSVRFDAADGENAAGASEHEAGTEVTLVAAPGDDSVFGG